MEDNKAEIWISAALLLWVIGGVYGYFFANTRAFRCYYGSGGFASRAWAGYMGGIESAPDPKYGPRPDDSNRRLTDGATIIPNPRDYGPENHVLKRLGLIIVGTATGYAIGASIRYAESAVNSETCQPPPGTLYLRHTSRPNE